MIEETDAQKRRSRYDTRKLTLAILSGLLIAAIAALLLRGQLNNALQSTLGDTHEVSAEPFIPKERTAPSAAENETTTAVEDDWSMADQFGELESRISAIEARPENDVGALEQRLDALDARIAALEASATGDTGAASEELSAEMQRMRQEMALFQLRQRLEEGQRYADLMPELAQHFGAAQLPYLTQLQQQADHPVPTPELLEQQFNRARQAAEAADIPEGIWPRIRHQLSQSVRIRRTGEQAYDPEAPLDQAEKMLNEGRIRAAIDTVRSLPESTQHHFSEWIASANAYLHQQRAIRELTASLQQQPSTPAAAPVNEPQATVETPPVGEAVPETLPEPAMQEAAQ